MVWNRNRTLLLNRPCNGSGRFFRNGTPKEPQLILPTQNLNQNTRLLHFAGIEPAPSAEPETISKAFEILFFCDNLFLGQWWFDKPLERKRVKAFHVRCETLTGHGTNSGKSNHFSKSCSTRLRVLRCNWRAADREIDQDGLAKRSPCG
jgi:hypothetical protein